MYLLGIMFASTEWVPLCREELGILTRLITVSINTGLKHACVVTNGTN